MLWNVVVDGRRRWGRSCARIGAKTFDIWFKYKFIQIKKIEGLVRRQFVWLYEYKYFWHLIQTQVGRLGKWMVGHLWLLHTPNHGQDVRLLLRYHWTVFALWLQCQTLESKCKYRTLQIWIQIQIQKCFQAMFCWVWWCWKRFEAKPMFLTSTFQTNATEGQRWLRQNIYLCYLYLSS